MKQIPISNGRAFALVDDEDYENLSRFKWYFHKGYAVRTEMRNCKTREIRMHREVLGLQPGDGLEGDHINGDKLDNQKCNLRSCTRSENERNKPLSSRNTSGFKGVCWNKKDKRWRAKIKVNGKIIPLGNYLKPEDAYAAYCKAALELHGEFANLGKAV